MTPMSKRYAYAIGDIHGRLDLLLKAIKAIEEDAKNRGWTEDDYTIITLGDYTDRGPDTKGVIEFLMKYPNIQSIAGNHEYILLNCFEWGNLTQKPWPHSSRDLASFLRNGGIETLESYGFEYNGHVDVDLSIIPREHIQWLFDLPIFIETENHFFVHAGVKPYVKLDDQHPNDLIWIRSEFFMEADSDNPFDWGKHIVHGHTPNYNYRPELKHNRTNLDCGGVWSGRQAIGLFDLTVQRGPIDNFYVEIPMPEEEVFDYDSYRSLDEHILGAKGVKRSKGLWDYSDR